MIFLQSSLLLIYNSIFGIEICIKYPHISLWGKKIQFMYSDRVTDITRTASEGPSDLVRPPLLSNPPRVQTI